MDPMGYKIEFQKFLHETLIFDGQKQDLSNLPSMYGTWNSRSETGRMYQNVPNVLGEWDAKFRSQKGSPVITQLLILLVRFT